MGRFGDRPSPRQHQDQDGGGDEADAQELPGARPLLEEEGGGDDGEDQFDLPKRPHVGRVLDGERMKSCK